MPMHFHSFFLSVVLAVGTVSAIGPGSFDLTANGTIGSPFDLEREPDIRLIPLPGSQVRVPAAQILNLWFEAIESIWKLHPTPVFVHTFADPNFPQQTTFELDMTYQGRTITWQDLGWAFMKIIAHQFTKHLSVQPDWDVLAYDLYLGPGSGPKFGRMTTSAGRSDDVASPVQTSRRTRRGSMNPDAIKENYVGTDSSVGGWNLTTPYNGDTGIMTSTASTGRPISSYVVLFLANAALSQAIWTENSEQTLLANGERKGAGFRVPMPTGENILVIYEELRVGVTDIQWGMLSIALRQTILRIARGTSDGNSFDTTAYLVYQGVRQPSPFLVVHYLARGMIPPEGIDPKDLIEIQPSEMANTKSNETLGEESSETS